MIVECDRLRKVFSTRNGYITALENISFRTERREFLCIVGPSGCGKTTVLKLIAGLLEPDAGRVSFSGFPAGGEPHTPLVFQEHGLFPWKTVIENVAFGLYRQRLLRAERRAHAHRFLQQVGLGRFANNYPHELSVGMRQRVNIARAFVSEAQILLMDEPFGSLDAQTKLILQEELLRIWKDHRKLIIYVTHDIREAILLGDRVLVMSGHPGRIRNDIPIPIERPRDLGTLNQPEVARIAEGIWNELKDEVIKSAWERE